MRDDNSFAVFLTCVMSHLAMIPCLVQLYRRRWIYEFSMNLFASSCSFMYHTCQAFRVRLFLSEMQWHRLDNIGALGCFGALFTYLSVVKDPVADGYLKIVTLFVSIIVQEHSPWNEVYTFLPILCFGCIPLIVHAFIHQRKPAFDMKNFAMGCGALSCAVPFFIAGLDDDHDPFRVYHGLWHVIGGLSAYYLWRIVKYPQGTAYQGGGAPKPVSSC